MLDYKTTMSTELKYGGVFPQVCDRH